MPINQFTIRTTPFIATHQAVTVLHSAGSHYVYDPADRKDEHLAPLPNGLVRATFHNNPGGNVYYLPFSANNIHSMRLPANPGFNATFVTANLDGCWVFVDRKNNGDVVVFHANASGGGFSPTVQQSATTPLFQTPGAQAQLVTHYNNAALHYAGTPTTNHWVLTKPRYLRMVHARLQRKAAQGRTGVHYAAPEHASYTTFVGFYTGGHWEFWFQTYSQFIYRRPKLHVKSAFGKRTHDPDVTYDPYEMVEATRWLVVP